VIEEDFDGLAWDLVELRGISRDLWNWVDIGKFMWIKRTLFATQAKILKFRQIISQESSFFKNFRRSRSQISSNFCPQLVIFLAFFCVNLIFAQFNLIFV